MYLPGVFHEQDPTTLQQVMEAHNFATLVTVHEGAPFATPLPFMLDRSQGRYGALVAHMARANPQWEHFTASQEALVIFQGPHAYISPSWYESEFAVPTWNYVAVHAYGFPQIVEDPATVQQMLEQLVDLHEAPRPQPWRFAWSERHLNLLKGVVAFRMEITRIEGKAKLSQNRPVEDRGGVIRNLRASPDCVEQAVAAQMAVRLPKGIG
ncbi:MAG: FMN-binding negative transcriptional regulator [Chloroflexi bacterium]|nr:MAG: FMN-binding negative transcriptional regulator [Chloroflexota bacterium]